MTMSSFAMASSCNINTPTRPALTPTITLMDAFMIHVQTTGPDAPLLPANVNVNTNNSQKSSRDRRAFLNSVLIQALDALDEIQDDELLSSNFDVASRK